MRRKRVKLIAALAAVGLVVGGVASTALADRDGHNGDGHDEKAGQVRSSAQGPRGVPPGFEPTASSWTSNDTGEVVGKAPCDSGRFCYYRLATDDGGASWTEKSVPDGLDGESDISDIATAESDDKSTRLLVDENVYTAYVSTDDETWQKVNLSFTWVDHVAQVGDYVYLVTTVEPGARQELGGRQAPGYHTYRAPVGSTDWKRADQLPGGSKRQVMGIDGRGSVGLVTGTPSLATSTDGETWTERDETCESSRGAVAGDTSMYLVCFEPEGEVEVKASDDAGKSFETVGTVEDPGQEYGVGEFSAYGDSVAFTGKVYGQEGPKGCLVTGSTDGGATWKTELEVGGKGLTAGSLRFTDAEHGTVVCHDHEYELGNDGAEVYRTTDGGSTWEPMGLNTSAADTDWFGPVSLSWQSSSTEQSSSVGHVLGWVPCDEHEFCAAIRTTADGGKTWTEAPAPEVTTEHSAYDRAELMFAERHGTTVAMAYLAGEKPYVSNDGGQTWEQLDIDVIDVSNVIESNEGVDFAATDTDVFASFPVEDEDGRDRAQLYRAPLGTSDFEPVDGVGEGNPSWSSRLSFADGTGVAALGGGINGEKAPIFTSSDGGKTWTKRLTPCWAYDGATYFAGGEGLIYVQCDGDVSKFVVSTDGGKTFDKVSTGPEWGMGIESGWASGDSIRLGSNPGDAGGCEVYSSDDGGTSWAKSQVDGPPRDPGTMVDLDLVDDSTGGALCAMPAWDDTQAAVVSVTTDGGKSWKPVTLTN